MALTRIPAKDTFPNTNSPANTNKFLDDINIAYSETSSELKLYDTDVIGNMIENVIMTVKGERVFEPEFGSDIPALLFEPCDETTAYYIETELFASIQRWVPYIKIDYANTRCIPNRDKGYFDLYIAYILLIGGTKKTLKLKLVQ